MERICRQCHAVVADETADWCPACGGALMERKKIETSEVKGRAAVEVDHRGIVLPRRHALGGIITPQ
jgi:RNA polymerase subunit RPABC4/transcription elongation factor Spt4